MTCNFRKGLLGIIVLLLLARDLTAGTELRANTNQKSAGLFVGIGKFEFRAGLEDLEYAPDDAVALAHRMVVELKMIPAASTQLVLGGDPKSARARKQLTELQALQVEVAKGTRNGFQKALEKFARRTGTGGLAVMSFSGHGYETQKDVYLMPSNGNWQTVRTTGVSFESVLEVFKACKATTKVLLLDACRQMPDMAKLDRELAEKAFRERVKAVPGLTVLASCSAGEKSWQAKSLEQGVFTYLILEGLKKPDEAWTDLGEKVVKANEAWFAKFEVKGPKAWVMRNDE